MQTTKEQALFHGLKLIVVLLEIVLLYVSLVADGDVSAKFLSAVLLSILSASLASIVGLFDDDIFSQYVSWPRPMRWIAILSLIFSFVLLVASFAFLCMLHENSFLGQNWLPIALIIAFLCIPRVLVYAFVFATRVMGMASVAENEVMSDIDKVVKEFGDR